MIGRGKRWRQRARSKEEDRISELPDPLICQVLSHLSTKDLVKTSVLSTRWRTLWLWVPRSDLDSREFPCLDAFVKHGDRFFDSDRASCIHKVNLTVVIHEGRDDGASYFHKSWIDAAVRRKVQHVHVQLHGGNWDYLEMPTSLFNCKTLVSLKLRSVKVTLDDHVGFVSLPCLKTLHLKHFYLNEASFERLVSCCPVLEELNISICVNIWDVKVFRVLSTSLKMLVVELLNFGHAFGSGFVIDAPRLRFLSVVDYLSESFLVNNMDSNAAIVDFALSFGLDVLDEATVSSRRSSIRRFLSGISKVTEMTLAPLTFELICLYSILEPLPQFGYVSTLHLNLYLVSFQSLPTFLKSFPNLKSLSLVCHGDYRAVNRLSFSFVPECLLSSLEFFNFNFSNREFTEELMLISYFLQTSVILKKLTVRISSDSSTENITLKRLLQIPRGSTRCQVVVL